MKLFSINVFFINFERKTTLKKEFKNCRPNCGACCIYISISSPIPGMPEGKPACVRCIHLTKDNLCGIFDSPDRPKVCFDYKAEKMFCGETREEAIDILKKLENLK